MVEIKRVEQFWFESKNLTFKDNGFLKPGAKTRHFSVFSRFNKSLLGYIKWFPHWKQYCFYPLNSLFDKDCLRQVAQFCEEATASHKSRLPNIKRKRDMMLAARKRKMERLALTKAEKLARMDKESERQLEPLPEEKLPVVEGVRKTDAPDID